MFQVLEFDIPSHERIVIDDELKSHYEGMTGVTVWTEDHKYLRLINLELKINSKEVLPAGFPAELFSINPFRNVSDCTLKVDFPKYSRIEGAITNENDEPVSIKLIIFIKL